jgi:hypothetical protein
MPSVGGRARQTSVQGAQVQGPTHLPNRIASRKHLHKCIIMTLELERREGCLSMDFCHYWQKEVSVNISTWACTLQALPSIYANTTTPYLRPVRGSMHFGHRSSRCQRSPRFHQLVGAGEAPGAVQRVRAVAGLGLRHRYYIRGYIHTPKKKYALK